MTHARLKLRAQNLRELAPGLAASAIVAAAAGFLAGDYAMPVMLLALLLGIN